MAERCIQCGSRSLSRKGQMFCSKECRYRYYHSRDMVLTLKKQWFDMILSGQKKEEYREVKPYWTKRFENYFGRHYDFSNGEPEAVWNEEKKMIVFRNGYGSNKPQFSAECTISEGTGREEWRAERGGVDYVLKIHRIFEVKNIGEK